ncbi:hypothetical protein, partial [Paracidobacterium acidisoli]|nr:hypothetical protein [Paracidobacterium acidisoli]
KILVRTAEVVVRGTGT